jgi:alanine dehydrogenase
MSRFPIPGYSSTSIWPSRPDNEYRVGIVPSTVRELTDTGHQVVIETQAGAGAGFLDAVIKALGPRSYLATPYSAAPN